LTHPAVRRQSATDWRSWGWAELLTVDRILRHQDLVLTEDEIVAVHHEAADPIVLHQILHQSGGVPALSHVPYSDPHRYVLEVEEATRPWVAVVLPQVHRDPLLRLGPGPGADGAAAGGRCRGIRDPGPAPGLANVDPAAYTRLRQAAEAGDWGAARDEQNRIARLFDIAFVPQGRSGDAGGIGAFKAALALLGVIDSAAMPAPLEGLSDDDTASIREILAEVGLLQ